MARRDSGSELLNKKTTVRVALGGLVVAAMLAGTTACAPKRPTGQVIALVNGQEITAHDLDAEARALGVQNSGPNGPILLQRVIPRILLAQAAHNQGVDKDPTYPADRLRAEQTMLAERLLRKTAHPDPKVTPAEVSQFVAAHPLIFRDRQKIALDQVRFQTTDPQSKLSAFQTMPALLQYLQTGGTQVQKGSQVIDSATVPPQMAAKLMSAPVGKLLLDRRGDMVMGGVVTARQSVILPPADQATLATQLIHQQRANQAITAEVDKYRKSSRILYQPGFAPPKTGA